MTDAYAPTCPISVKAHRVVADTLADIEWLLETHALAIVNHLARKRRVSPHHLALAVPGLCHSHVPDDRLHTRAPDVCAYCQRRGNCFAVG